MKMWRPIHIASDQILCMKKRFEGKVKKSDECWRWVGNKTRNGYGLFYVHGDHYVASRIAWVIYKGPLDADQCVLHKCDTPSCVNPDHLFLGSQQDNSDDAKRKGRITNGRTLWTHCKNGHEFNEKNTYIRKDRGTRECRACNYSRFLKRSGLVAR